MKSTIITLLAFLIFSIPTFAQNNAVTNNLTAKDKAEYTLKFLVKETTISNEQLTSLRKIMLEGSDKLTVMENSLQNSDPAKIEQTLGAEIEAQEAQIEVVLTAAQYVVYEDIRDNLSTKIGTYKNAQQAAYPTSK